MNLLLKRRYTVQDNPANGALFLQALCTYFHNEDVPIAAFRPITNDTFFDSFFYLSVSSKHSLCVAATNL